MGKQQCGTCGAYCDADTCDECREQERIEAAKEQLKAELKHVFCIVIHSTYEFSDKLISVHSTRAAAEATIARIEACNKALAANFEFASGNYTPEKGADYANADEALRRQPGIVAEYKLPALLLKHNDFGIKDSLSHRLYHDSCRVVEMELDEDTNLSLKE